MCTAVVRQVPLSYKKGAGSMQSHGGSNNLEGAAGSKQSHGGPRESVQEQRWRMYHEEGLTIEAFHHDEIICSGHNPIHLSHSFPCCIPLQPSAITLGLVISAQHRKTATGEAVKLDTVLRDIISAFLSESRPEEDWIRLAAEIYGLESRDE
eukprot:gene28888-32082_t